jgi:hypothetical protein
MIYPDPSITPLTIDTGNYYYATDAGVGLTSDSGIDDDIRGRFMHDGKLANSKDPNFRAIQDHWPVFAFAVDLGSVSGNVVNTLFSLGMCQDQAVQFLGANGLVSLPPLWKSYFGSDEDAVSSYPPSIPLAMRLTVPSSHSSTTTTLNPPRNLRVLTIRSPPTPSPSPAKTT